MITCSEEGCTKLPKVKGMCAQHYNSDYRRRRGCKVEGCEGTFRAMDFCRKHYEEYKKDNWRFLSVPRTLARESYMGVVKDLGFNPNNVLRIEMDTDGYVVEMKAFDEKGKPFLSDNATHKIYVKVV